MCVDKEEVVGQQDGALDVGIFIRGSPGPLCMRPMPKAVAVRAPAAMPAALLLTVTAIVRVSAWPVRQ